MNLEGKAQTEPIMKATAMLAWEYFPVYSYKCIVQ